MTAAKQAYLQWHNHQYIPLHQQAIFLDSLVGPEGWDVVGIQNKNLDWIALLPFHMKKKWGFNYITHPILCKWISPLFAPEVPDPYLVFKQLIAELPAHAYLEQHYFYNFSAHIQQQAHISESYTEEYSYQLDLKVGEQALYDGLNSDYRNNKIKKAAASVTIEECTDLDTFYSINNLSFKRQNISCPYSLAYFKKHASALIDHDRARLFKAIDHNGAIHSVVMLSWDEQCAYYHLAGDDPVLRKSGSGIYLAWHCILYALKTLQVPFFDFEGSMIPGVEKVRQKFGAQKRIYLKNIAYPSTVFKKLQRLKSKL